MALFSTPVLILSLIFIWQCTARSKKAQSGEICALFEEESSQTSKQKDGNYIDLGRQRVDDRVVIELSVLVSEHDNDGTLLAISSVPRFNYRERLPYVQYLAVEIQYSSVVLTVKGVGPERSRSFEVICSTKPLYNIGDGNWHVIKAWRLAGYWHLSIDGKFAIEPVLTGAKTNTNIYMEQGYAYMGGRPGYTERQFLGIIKNVHINSQPVSLPGLPHQLQIEIVSCDSQNTLQFYQWLMASPVSSDEYNPWCGSRRRRKSKKCTHD